MYIQINVWNVTSTMDIMIVKMNDFTIGLSYGYT